MRHYNFIPTFLCIAGIGLGGCARLLSATNMVVDICTTEKEAITGGSGILQVPGATINEVATQFVFYQPMTNWVLSGWLVFSNASSIKRTMHVPVNCAHFVEIIDSKNHRLVRFRYKQRDESGGIHDCFLKLGYADYDAVTVDPGKTATRKINVYVNIAFRLERGETYRLQMVYSEPNDRVFQSWMKADLRFKYTGDDIIFTGDEDPLGRIMKEEALRRKTETAFPQGGKH